MAGIAIPILSTACNRTFTTFCKLLLHSCLLIYIIIAFRYLKMKNVDELTGAESCVCIYSCCIIFHSIFGLISIISFVHSRIFDVVHAGDRNVVTLKRTVDTTWIPEQQAFILTRESSVSNFKLSEALGTLEAISSMFSLSICGNFWNLRCVAENLFSTLDAKFSVSLQKQS